MVSRGSNDRGGGRELPVVVNVALEAWEPNAAPGISPMGNPLPGGAFDNAAASWGRYGAKRGMRRILEVLELLDVRATVMTSAILCETDRELVEQIHQQGHDICAHGYAQNRVPASMTLSEEQDEIVQSTEILQSVLGRHPRGWISPRCTPSSNTSELLVANGYLWHGDCCDDDRAYIETTANGQILAFPLTMEINDLPMVMKYGVSGEEYTDAFRSLVESAVRQPDPPGHIDITVHAHVGGRPHLIGAFIDALEFALDTSYVRLTTRDELYATLEKDGGNGLGN